MKNRKLVIVIKDGMKHYPKGTFLFLKSKGIIKTDREYWLVQYIKGPYIQFLVREEYVEEVFPEII